MPRPTPLYIPMEIFPIKAILDDFQTLSVSVHNGTISSFENPCLISEKTSQKLRLSADQIQNVGWTFELYWRPTSSRPRTMVKLIKRPDNLYFVSSIMEGVNTYSFPIFSESAYAFYMKEEE